MSVQSSRPADSHSTSPDVGQDVERAPSIASSSPSALSSSKTCRTCRHASHPLTGRSLPCLCASHGSALPLCLSAFAPLPEMATSRTIGRSGDPSPINAPSVPLRAPAHGRDLSLASNNDSVIQYYYLLLLLYVHGTYMVICIPFPLSSNRPRPKAESNARLPQYMTMT